MRRIRFPIFMFISAVGGYLFYKEETGLDDHSNEILTVPVAKRTAMIDLKVSGRTRSRINIWVRGAGLTEAKGKIVCNQNTRNFGTRTHYRERTDGPHPHKWLRSLRMSSRTKPKKCVAQFTRLKGKGPFEVVVTKSSRPSDWF